VDPEQYGALFHALAPMVQAARDSAAKQPNPVRVASDAASVAGFAARFPKAGRARSI
jgi:hypothetical protein